MSQPIFELRQATYNYNDVPALRAVDLQIQPGQRVAVLGANGSGKSTLLRLLDALYFANAGELLFDGAPVTEAAFQSDKFAFDFRRRVGLVFQNPDVQLFNPTVFDEIAFGPLQLRWDKAMIRERIAQTMERMEIAHLKDRSPHRLSGGEKQRVALASVLVTEPEVLLLDEPTAALDPTSQSRIVDFLSDRSDHKTIVTATHDLDIIEEIADICHVFRRGQLIASAPPADILADEDLLRSTNLIRSHRHHHASHHGARQAATSGHSHAHAQRAHEH